MENILVELPPSPGVYALHLTLAHQKQLQVGYLGEKLFPSGEYIYLGSAQCPGGLRARLRRHLSNNKSKRLHWHIDYLRQVSIIHGIHFVLWQNKESLMIPLECAWSQMLINSPQASVPVKHFGSSDCKSGCPAHYSSISPYKRS